MKAALPLAKRLKTMINPWLSLSRISEVAFYLGETSPWCLELWIWIGPLIQAVRSGVPGQELWSVLHCSGYRMHLNVIRSAAQSLLLPGTWMWSGALHSYCYYLAPECDQNCTVTVTTWLLDVIRRTAQLLLLPGTWMWSGELHSYRYYLAPECDQANCTVTVTTWPLNVIRSTAQSRLLRIWKLVTQQIYSRPNHFQNQFWYITDWTISNTFLWILNQYTVIFIPENEFGNVICKMADIFSLP